MELGDVSCGEGVVIRDGVDHQDRTIWNATCFVCHRRLVVESLGHGGDSTDRVCGGRDDQLDVI